jgi:hypothetical protein
MAATGAASLRLGVRRQRTSVVKRAFQITVALVVSLVLMSAYPGLIASTVFSLLGVITLLPLLGLWFLFIAVTAVREIVQRRPITAALGAQAAALSIFAFGLVVLRVPLRMAFAFSQPAFERFMRSTALPDDDKLRAESISRWFGIYHVDRWAHDSRGGVFFRTGTGADMIDTMSYGFAFHPNREGSPFGRAGYFLSPIAGEWHTFSVSDDYY